MKSRTLLHLVATLSPFVLMLVRTLLSFLATRLPLLLARTFRPVSTVIRVPSLWTLRSQNPRLKETDVPKPQISPLALPAKWFFYNRVTPTSFYPLPPW